MPKILVESFTVAKTGMAHIISLDVDLNVGLTNIIIKVLSAMLNNFQMLVIGYSGKLSVNRCGISAQSSQSLFQNEDTSNFTSSQNCSYTTSHSSEKDFQNNADSDSIIYGSEDDSWQLLETSSSKSDDHSRLDSHTDIMLR